MSSSYEESILRSLRRISQANDLHSRRLAKEHELTVPQLVCLRHLKRHGRTTAGALARAVSLSQGTMTGILKRLVGRELITRIADDSDRRRVLLELTDAGAVLVDNAPFPLQEDFSRRLGELHDGEQALYDWVLQRIAVLMQAESALPASEEPPAVRVQAMMSPQKAG